MTNISHNKVKQTKSYKRSNETSTYKLSLVEQVFKGLSSYFLLLFSIQLLCFDNDVCEHKNDQLNGCCDQARANKTQFDVGMSEVNGLLVMIKIKGFYP